MATDNAINEENAMVESSIWNPDIHPTLQKKGKTLQDRHISAAKIFGHVASF